MKNDLTCGVARDLLPSYVEGLLCQESQQAVDRHLADCPGCAAALSAMRSPEGEAPPEEPPREVDYLKRMKKRGRFKIIAAAVCAGLVVVAAFLYQMFERGTPLDPQMVGVAELSVVEREDGKYLHLSLGTPESAAAFHSWRTATAAGPGIESGEVSYLTARKVLVSALHSDGGVSMDIPLNENQKEVWLGSTSGRLLWQDGVVISQTALELLDTKTPYCGDPSALNRIAQALRLSDRLGSYTNSLYSYGWTLTLANPINEEQYSYLSCCAILSLALVDNLEQSMCQYPQSGSDPNTVVNSGFTLTDVNHVTIPTLVKEYNAVHGTDWTPKANVKDYTETPADFQRLLLMLDSYYGTDLASP